MVKTKTDLSFIHRFIPPKDIQSDERAIQLATEGKAFTTFLLLHSTGGNEEDLIPLAYEIDKRAAILTPRAKVLENGIT